MAGNDAGTTFLLVTPPFTQLNTPYPATAFLKGFLNQFAIPTYQADLGIEVISRLFSTVGLSSVFAEIDENNKKLSSNARRIVDLKFAYLTTIEPVMQFLRGNSPELAHLICTRNWLPEASRFDQTADFDSDFGQLGIGDKAKHIATLYLEDISDLIIEAIDPHFGFSRYAERLGRSASSFDEIYAELNDTGSETLIVRLMTELLEESISRYNPSAIALTVPFPGNLFSALKCGQWIKARHPGLKVLMGGGYVNTELRSLSDPRVFRFVDYITLDDGEIPLLHLTEFFDGNRSMESLTRTFTLTNSLVQYYDGSGVPDVDPRDTGTPDYSGLPLEKYISVIELANPMHRLWSDGRWNKLMLAHGCYWGKCTFCDVTLDYIHRYQPNTAQDLCDRMESIIAQTGRNGFHFTDEAAPPVLLRDLAMEILRRKMTVTWWTNIRFEKKFTNDLCRLLQASGCIAVSGGLEVASDRILKLINKGVTVPQVARIAGNFTNAGIMVHAYLMYGFPTQTARETVDSLEVVRQLFLNGVVQSGFWHQFAMTAHSPVGQDPERFGVEKEEQPQGTFANNDLIPIDRMGCDHRMFSDGLKKSLYNYMHGICFDFPLQEWFDFRIPGTTVAPHFIRNLLKAEESEHPMPDMKLVWIGSLPRMELYTRVKKGKSSAAARIILQTNRLTEQIRVNEVTGQWIMDLITTAMVDGEKTITFREASERYAALKQGDFNLFTTGDVFTTLRKCGLLII